MCNTKSTKSIASCTRPFFICFINYHLMYGHSGSSMILLCSFMNKLVEPMSRFSGKIPNFILFDNNPENPKFFVYHERHFRSYFAKTRLRNKIISTGNPSLVPSIPVILGFHSFFIILIRINLNSIFITTT